MPRLPDSTREMLERGEEPAGGGSREPVEDGYYLVKFNQVKETEEKESGYAGVDLRTEIVQPTKQAGRKIEGYYLWDFLSYGPNSGWKVRRLFEATEYSFDSDFQELVDGEEECIVEVSTQIQQKGKNKNKARNQIEDYFPVNDETMALLAPDED